MGRGGDIGLPGVQAAPSGAGETSVDEISSRLSRLRDRLTRELADVATVVEDRQRGFGPSIVVTPHRAGAVAVNWWDWGPGSQMQVEVEGNSGSGVFVLPDRDREAVEFIKTVVEAVIAGRVVEYRCAGRSSLEVTTADGDTFDATSMLGLAWLIPRPRWRDRATRTWYLSYREKTAH